MRLLYSLIFMLMPQLAPACECKADDLNATIAKEAVEVFVFQLVSAELQQEPLTAAGEPYLVEGRINVVDVVYGAPPIAQRVKFSVSNCCGMRMSVGRYYFAFLPTASANVFVADSSTTFDPGVDGYHVGLNRGIRAAIETMMRGGPDLAEDDWADSWLNLQARQPPFRAWKRRCQ